MIDIVRFLLRATGAKACLILLSALQMASAEDRGTVMRDMTDPNGDVRPYVRFLDQDGDRVEEKGFFDVSRKWLPERDGTTLVFVCWENPPAALALEMAWVREAVENTWQRHSLLRFRGWAPCNPDSQGIRIAISDEGPHTIGLGTVLNGRPRGMVLNFTYSAWVEGRSCQAPQQHRERCIRWTAVHEFGHAIGFAHEHNRTDRDRRCTIAPQGDSRGAKELTEYDPDSVMNYCNTQNYRNDGTLSGKDIKSVQMMYGIAR